MSSEHAVTRSAGQQAASRATSPGSGWASGPWSSGRAQRWTDGCERLPITLSERRAHRRVVGDRCRCHRVGATRDVRDMPMLGRVRSQAHGTSRSQAHEAVDVGTSGGDRSWDALVVGGGPAGAAAAYWLAEAGHRVLVVEKKRFPREKTCGDGLTPARRPPAPRHGPRRPARRSSCASTGCARSRTASPWSCRGPTIPTSPTFGYVVRRRDLDEMVAERGRRRPAPTVWTGAEAVEPLVDDGLVTGAVDPARRRRPSRCGRSYVVVADGANSRFGRALGTARDRTYPLGMAVRGLLHQPVPRRAVDREPPRPARPRRQPPAGLRLDLPGGRRHGERRRRAAVHLLGWKSINTSVLMDAFVATAPARWGISPETSCGAPTGGKLPTGGSVDAEHRPHVAGGRRRRRVR